jgi:hypothetical protein
MNRLCLIIFCVFVLPTALLAQISLPMHWARSNIEVNFDETRSVYAADLDGDGDNDVLGAAYSDNQIAWWRNDGEGNFGTKRIITNDFLGAQSVYAADLDSDGDIDVLGAAYNDNQIAWWGNDGGGGPTSPTDHPNFTKHVIDDFTNAVHIYAIDLDNDNDIDVIATGVNDQSPTWWENNGYGNFTKHTIQRSEGILDFSVGDLDRDGDVDIVGTNPVVGSVYWFENDGGNPPSFIEHLFTVIYSPGPIHATDLDTDGDADIILGGEFVSYLIWYENRQDLAGEDLIIFTGHTILYPVPNCASSIYAIDLDNDMDRDFLVTYSALRDDNISLIWFENNGNENFSGHIVGRDFYGSSCGYAANIDNNDFPDILGASSNRDNISWWRNHLGDGDVSISPRPTGGENLPNNTSQNVMGTHNSDVVAGSSDIPNYFSFGPRNNPAKGKAMFNLALPEAADVTLRIYDATGRLIDKVISGRQAAGYYEIPWNKEVSPGVYFYTFESIGHKETGKLVLVN